MNGNFKNKGITLIALVITIIVLLILAGVTITTLTGDNGIIQKAGEAKNDTTDAEIKEQIKLAYQDYYISKYNEPGYDLQDALDKVFVTEDVRAEGEGPWTITVRNKSYNLALDGSIDPILSKWTYDGQGTYRNGTMELKVGQKINYDEGTGYTFTPNTNKGMGINSTYNTGMGKHELTSGVYTTEDMNWRILGINNEGQIELISETPHPVIVYVEDEEGYYNGADELDKLNNALYGKGFGAVSARNLKITDLNKLANYDPSTDTTSNSRYNTYRKYRFTSNAYEYSDSEDGETNWSNWKSIPSFYGVNKYIILGSNITLSNSNPGESRAIKNTCYSYNVEEKITNAISEEIANLIFSSSSEYYQWLSSSCVSAGDPCTNYGLYLLRSSDWVELCSLCSSNGNSSCMNGREFRPVVTLKSDVNIQFNQADNQWEIQQ